jgi:Kef-type K+ transport system membrane component KefB
VGFGFFVPFFFITSGIEFDLAALGSAEAIAKLVMFFGLFLVVRGTPALLLYRRVLSARDRAALAFFSATELPLVVAITTIAVEGGHMKTSTAAGLVGAAMLSTLVFPFVGMALRRRSPAEQAGSTGPESGGPAEEERGGPTLEGGTAPASAG